MEEGARGRVECSRGGVGFVMMGCGVLQAGIKEGEGIRCVGLTMVDPGYIRVWACGKLG